MEATKTLEKQLKSICVYEYMLLFTRFENLLKTVFENDIVNLKKSTINELYFYYGSMCKAFVDTNERRINANPLPFNEDEKFPSLTAIQIVKISSNHPEMMLCLQEEIDSFRTKMCSYSALDISKRLIEMRNKMAHDIINADFSKCVIELLPIDLIKQKNYDFFEGYDLELLDESGRDIISNYLYMEQVIELLEKV